MGKTYRITLADGPKFLMSADLRDASAPILVNFHGSEEDWQSTPFQTADARHNAYRAASLIAQYFQAGPDDTAEVESVEEV